MASLSSHSPPHLWQVCHKAALLVSACTDALQLSFAHVRPSIASAGRLSSAASEALDVACALAPLAFTTRCDFPVADVERGLCVAPLEMLHRVFRVCKPLNCAVYLHVSTVLCYALVCTEPCTTKHSAVMNSAEQML